MRWQKRSKVQRLLKRNYINATNSYHLRRALSLGFYGKHTVVTSGILIRLLIELVESKSHINKDAGNIPIGGSGYGGWEAGTFTQHGRQGIIGILSGMCQPLKGVDNPFNPALP